MEDFAYLRRLIEERLGEAGLRAGHRDLDVQFKLLRYAESEGQEALKRSLLSLDAKNAELDAKNAELAALMKERDAAHAHTQALYASTSWRITWPLRRMVKMLRGSQPASETALATATAATTSDRAYQLATAALTARFGLDSLPLQPLSLHMLLGSGALMRTRISAARPRPATEDDAALRFSIITPYFAHLDFFARCAASVESLMQADLAKTGAPRVSWIVVNDDPSCPEDRLATLVPASIREHVRILSDGRNRGIAAALNHGIAHAGDSWLLLLDCDDTIEPNAIRVLDSYILANPACRYFSSAMIDIDENGTELRRRRQEYGPEALFEVGMVVGHLVAFRRDLFEELGGFDQRVSGVQDYHFALRAALQEPIRQLPDYLYRYRWHPNTVSVGRALRQARLTDAARADVLRRHFALSPRLPLARTPLPTEARGLCIIRTQGTRMELLAQAVASVRAQAVTFTPCIVVHGDAARRDFVDRWLQASTAAASGPAPIVLGATDAGRRRGYPCNVGLDHLAENADSFDLLCFLDDDDHLLPDFSARLLEALRAGDADLAFGQTNALPMRGEPFLQHQLLPAVALFHGNFMPIHSYIVRTEAVLAAKARFDETLHYLEDWDFLLQIVAAGGRAVPLFETVAEYRILGDGNTEQKRDQAHFEHCMTTVRARGAVAAARLPGSVFWADVLDFPTDRRAPLAPGEIAHLEAARDLFPPLETP
jgi:GT2 family glycosyltransferase